MKLAGLALGSILCAGLALVPVPYKQWALVRNIASPALFFCCLVGHGAAKREIERQRAFERWQHKENHKQQLIEESTLPVIVREAVSQEKKRAESATTVFNLDADRATATVLNHKHPEWVKAQLEASRTSQQDEIKQPIDGTSEPEPDSERTDGRTKEELKIQTKAKAKALLLELIANHEGGWVGQLMLKPLLVWGDMGSYKSYFVAFLALCRHYLYDHQIISIADPHFHQNRSLCWEKLVALGVPGCGANHDYHEVGEQLRAMYERFATRKLGDVHFTSIFDEVTKYSKKEGTVEPAKELIPSLIGDPRKAEESPILIGHDNTLIALGGGEGFSKSRDSGIIQLNLRSDSNLKPLFRGTISGIKDEEGEFIKDMKITLDSSWMSPDYVWSLFEGDSQTATGLATKPATGLATKPATEPATKIEPDGKTNPTTHKNANSPSESDAKKLDRIMQIPDDYWLAEFTPEELDKLIELRRQQVSDLPEPDTGIPSEIPAEPLPAKALPDCDAADLISKHFPQTTETQLFEGILEYLDTSKNASDIIKGALKCTKPDKDSSRSYSNVGKPVFIYLIRKYGPTSLIAHFADFLDKQ